MFGIGFPELMLIGVVALIVIGPERLPKVARTAGAWLGRLNRYTAQIKADIDRELRMDELRDMQQSVKESVQKYEIMTEEATEQVKKEAAEVKEAVDGVAKEVSAAAAAVGDEPVADSAETAKIAEAPEVSEASASEHKAT